MRSRVRLIQFVSTSMLATAVMACGPTAGSDDDDDTNTTCTNPVAEVCGNATDDDCDGMQDCDDDDCATDPHCANPNCTPVPEICNNGVDDDCDNIGDCDDADCSADSHCANANCGTLQNPTGSLALPDGACDVSGTCQGFENAINFTGFTAGQTLNDITKLRGICLNIEHSWLRDITVAVRCPNGTLVNLSGFQGRTGGEVFLGVPNDADDVTPVPGTGWDYCFTPNAVDPSWIPYANAHPTEHTLHSGDYGSTDPMSNLLGCPLNGDWTIRVEDRWGIDNGFIFNWSVKFDPSLVADCSTWPG